MSNLDFDIKCIRPDPQAGICNFSGLTSLVGLRDYASFAGPSAELSFATQNSLSLAASGSSTQYIALSALNNNPTGPGSINSSTFLPTASSVGSTMILGGNTIAGAGTGAQFINFLDAGTYNFSFSLAAGPSEENDMNIEVAVGTHNTTPIPSSGVLASGTPFPHPLIPNLAAVSSRVKTTSDPLDDTITYVLSGQGGVTLTSSATGVGLVFRLEEGKANGIIFSNISFTAEKIE
jgi:hypothetical protein